MLFADKLGMPKKIKDLAESLDLEVTNHHDPEFDAKLCALIFGELTDKYPPLLAKQDCPLWLQYD
ncbi:hypothetical protein [Parabacteroides merdae]|uniref:hypothetical protein n=1 Tax=Parabacteroides merdae TaxID=46503 RepID=UPI003564EB61